MAAPISLGPGWFSARGRDGHKGYRASSPPTKRPSPVNRSGANLDIPKTPPLSLGTGSSFSRWTDQAALLPPPPATLRASRAVRAWGGRNLLHQATSCHVNHRQESVILWPTGGLFKNSSYPLPKGLPHQLAPETAQRCSITARIPWLARCKGPSLICTEHQPCQRGPSPALAASPEYTRCSFAGPHGRSGKTTVRDGVSPKLTASPAQTENSLKEGG